MKPLSKTNQEEKMREVSKTIQRVTDGYDFKIWGILNDLANRGIDLDKATDEVFSIFSQATQEEGEKLKSQFNKDGHLLVIRDRKTKEVIDSLQLVWTPENTVSVFYKGNVSVESKKLKDLLPKK